LIAFRLEAAYYSAALCRGRALAIVSPRPLCAVGIVSCGVFPYHQLVLASCDLGQKAPRTWMNFARTATVALALSVTAGYLSWR
jgi:hypothetical protein